MTSSSRHNVSDRLRHFFHAVSNVRPIIWISLYVALTPVFALVYYLLPDSQFRIPDGAATDFGSWLYYSIVTISTLGFGDYTPAHGWAQAVTAIEVMCGLIILGLFLNAVGSMKSEIDVDSEIERQRKMHLSAQTDKLLSSIPGLLHVINTFLAYCYAMTTPKRERNVDSPTFNPHFGQADMADIYLPSGLPEDASEAPCIAQFLRSASRTSLLLDSLQNRIDLTLWPDLLEDCFSFVANYQMYLADENYDAVLTSPGGADHRIPSRHLSSLIRENGSIALRLETRLTEIANAPRPHG